jgi:hypothetical protein
VDEVDEETSKSRKWWWCAFKVSRLVNDHSVQSDGQSWSSEFWMEAAAHVTLGCPLFTHDNHDNSITTIAM